MKIDSEKINDLLKYARERHGAPCRVHLEGIDSLDWDHEGVWHWNHWDFVSCDIYYRDIYRRDDPVERILI